MSSDQNPYDIPLYWLVKNGILVLVYETIPTWLGRKFCPPMFHQTGGGFWLLLIYRSTGWGDKQNHETFVEEEIVTELFEAKNAAWILLSRPYVEGEGFSWSRDGSDRIG